MTIRRAAVMGGEKTLVPQSKGVVDGHILDDWPQIICNVKSGRVGEFYQEGDWAEIDLGEYGKNILVLSFVTHGAFLDEEMTINPLVKWTTVYLCNKQYTVEAEGYRWPDSSFKVFFSQILLNTLPEVLKENIVPVWMNVTVMNKYVKDLNYLIPQLSARGKRHDVYSMYQEHYGEYAYPPLSSSSDLGGATIGGMGYNSLSSGTGFAWSARNQQLDINNRSGRARGGTFWLSFSFYM